MVCKNPTNPSTKWVSCGRKPTHFLGKIIALFNSGSFLSGHIWLMGLCTAPSSNCLLQLPRNYQSLLDLFDQCQLRAVASSTFFNFGNLRPFSPGIKSDKHVARNGHFYVAWKFQDTPKNGENPRQVLTRLTIKDVDLAHDLTGGAHHRRCLWNLICQWGTTRHRVAPVFAERIYLWRSTSVAHERGLPWLSKQPNVHMCRSIMCRLKNDEKWVDKFTWV